MANSVKYAIVDIETTGGAHANEKITEIAIIVLEENGEIIESYETLINPLRRIPPHITRLTGITNQMVANSPTFEEVAYKINALTDQAIFVAHNVGFDYGFLQLEFSRIGIEFKRRRLCTVKLSRAVFPGFRSYSLGNLIKRFDIQVADRHRAMADTQATVIVFQEILKKDTKQTLELQLNNGLLEKDLPSAISIDVLHDLPEETGVYFFHDAEGKILYIGKGINIQTKVMRQLANNSDRMKRLKNELCSITCEPTGNKLIMLITEVLELDTHRPKFNLNINKNRFGFCIHQYKNASGHICLAVAPKKRRLHVIAEYETLVEAEELLLKKSSEAGICCRYIITTQPKLSNCPACSEQRSPDAHNKRVEQTIETLHIPFKRNFVLIGKGRTQEERSVIQIQDGHFYGFGFFEPEYTKSMQDLLDSIHSKTHLPVFEYFIKMAIRKKEYYKLIVNDG